MEDATFFSFWGHIEELRKILFRIFLIIGLGFLVALFFYKSIFQAIVPQSLENPTFTKEVLHFERIVNSSLYPTVYKVPKEAYVFPNQSGVLLLENHHYRIESNHQLNYEIAIKDSKLLITNPLEGILLSFKVCFWVSISVTSPVWIYCLLKFIIPALQTRERTILFPFILSSFFFICLGLMVAYEVTIPLANKYLENFNSDIGYNLWSLSHYIEYTLIIFLGHAIAFELCVILLFMVHLNLLSTEWLISKRRYMIVCAFVLGALLTPPDVFTQLLLAIPLMIVYELAIIYSRIRLKLGSELV